MTYLGLGKNILTFILDNRDKSATIILYQRADLAQLVEQRTRNA